MPAGLTDRDVEQKLIQFGYNELVDPGKVTPLQILFRQVKSNFVVYLLLAASIISFSVGKSFTGYTILLVITAVITIGFIQEFKAERAISDLKSMLMPISIVIRNGHKREIPSREIVPDDILVLGNGEKIPADCIIIEAYDLRVNESALTGESREVSKQANNQDSTPTDLQRLYMGTYIVNGRALAVVTHTGMSTKFGKIAHLISTAEKDLPLQKKVNDIAKYMVTVALISATATSLLMLFRAPIIDQSFLIEVLILAVAIAVSAFPEGFPVVLITTLAVGAKRMSNRNAIVNRMSIIETLGETTVICSDKTGTITRGEMTVKFVFTGSNLYEVQGTGFIVEGNILNNGSPASINDSNELSQLIKAGIVCNDAEIERTGNGHEYRAVGSATEVALLILGAKANLFSENFEINRVKEFPFNSDRKMMSVVVLTPNDGPVVYAKGAPEVLIEKCNRILINDKLEDFTYEMKLKYYGMQNEMASNAYRTLALAYKQNTEADNSIEDKLIFLGLVAMEDPPRQEVSQSIKVAKAAGIKVVMITGDNKDTAKSIAQQIGLEPIILEGKQIDELSDAELKVAVSETIVFARVRPEHKIRIVAAFKELGEIVAMTGDGVNDAPALKEAHIGIAMGKNGTDVSRSASDLILKDDNFTTIVSAIAEGRTIFNNLRKFVTYQLGCNLAELSVLFIGVLLAPVFGWYIPIIMSIQILFMNLVTDNLPAITLGLNPTSRDIMAEMPRKNGTILNKTLIRLLLVTGGTMAILTLISYNVSLNILHLAPNESQTTALVTLILLEIVTAFSYRSFRKPVLTRSPFVNRYLVGASIISLLATFLILYTPLNIYFESTPITLTSWILSVFMALFMVMFNDILKFINNRSQEYIANTR